MYLFIFKLFGYFIFIFKIKANHLVIPNLNLVKRKFYLVIPNYLLFFNYIDFNRFSLMNFRYMHSSR